MVKTLIQFMYPCGDASEPYYDVYVVAESIQPLSRALFQNQLDMSIDSEGKPKCDFDGFTERFMERSGYEWELICTKIPECDGIITLWGKN